MLCGVFVGSLLSSGNLYFYREAPLFQYNIIGEYDTCYRKYRRVMVNKCKVQVEGKIYEYKSSTWRTDWNNMQKRRHEGVVLPAVELGRRPESNVKI